MRHAVVRFGALFAAVIIAGCYLYSPDVTLDSRIKADPAAYICGPNSAHPWATLKEAPPWGPGFDVTCLTALEQQRWALTANAKQPAPAQGLTIPAADQPPQSQKRVLAPIVLIPREGSSTVNPDAYFNDPDQLPGDYLRDDDQLLSAIAYAEFARDQYMAAKRQGGSLPPFLATVLAPIGGTALALGAIGISPTTVTSLGAAAGTIVGGASVVQSKDREKIYVTGSEGVQCLLNNMQPYTYVDREKLRELYVLLGNLQYDRSIADTLIAQVQSKPTTKCLAKETDDGKKLRTQLLIAAQEADKAAATTNDVGFTFLRTAHDSPSTIVYTVDRINNNVSDSIINTEPDVQTLAQNLQKVIKTEEQTIIQSIPSAKSTTKQASTDTPPPTGTTTTVTTASDGTTTIVVSPKPPAPLASGESKAVHIAAPPAAVNKPEFKPPYAPWLESYSLEAQLSEALLNMAFDAGRILDIVGDNIKAPKNDACTTIEKKSGQPKALTLVPDGDIVLKKGGHSDLTVAGAQYPYVRPLFGQDQPTVTATLKEDSVLEVAATQDAKSGEYPFFVGDGPTGKPVTAVILYEKDECEGQPATPNPSGVGHPPQHHHRHAAVPSSSVPPSPGPNAATPSSENDDGPEQPDANSLANSSIHDDDQTKSFFASRNGAAIDYSNPYGY